MTDTASEPKTEDELVQERIDATEKRRAARRAGDDREQKKQKANDLDVLDGLEEVHGRSNIARIDVDFTPGLPTMCLARSPSPIETKRYRQSLKPKDADATQAAEAIAEVTLIYPDKDTFKAMCVARTGLMAQLGVAALALALGKAAAEGKG